MTKCSTERCLGRQSLSPWSAVGAYPLDAPQRGSSWHGSLLVMPTMNGLDELSDALRLTAPNPLRGVRERLSHSRGV